MQIVALPCFKLHTYSKPIRMPFFTEKYNGIDGFQCWSLGPVYSNPSVIRNVSNNIVNFLGLGCDHLVWKPDSLTLHPGPQGEMPAICLLINRSGKYYLVADFKYLGISNKNMETLVLINSNPIWISSTLGDRFVGEICVESGDVIELSVSNYPNQTFDDSTVQISYKLFQIDDITEQLIIVDDDFSTSNTVVELLNKNKDINIHNKVSNIVLTFEYEYGLWHQQLGMQHIEHLESCYKLDIYDIFTKLKNKNLESPIKKYCIFFTPRSGSTHLTEILAHTNLLGIPTELYTEHLHKALMLLQREPCVDNLDFLTNQFQTSNGVFGLELDLRPLSFYKNIFYNRNDWSYVFYSRRNILEQAISLYCARMFNLWSSRHDVSGQPIFNREGILECLCELAGLHEQFENIFEEMGISPLRLYYEDMLSDKNEVITKLSDYIGVNMPTENLQFTSTLEQKIIRKNYTEGWVFDILNNGGDFKGYDISCADHEYIACLSGFDIAKLKDPFQFKPIAFKAESLNKLHEKIQSCMLAFL